MLAQSFLDASALSIPETHRQALMKTLVLLETGKLVHSEMDTHAVMRPLATTFTGHFNMVHWRARSDCGSICCIGGTAEMIGQLSFGRLFSDPALQELFHANSVMQADKIFRLWMVSPAQAAIALRSYLTTGAANWKEALATS
jgi:hypothetical protein